MEFPAAVKVELLFRCGRHCCICRRSCGRRMEIHHIIQDADGGHATLDNGIPLCYDCHDDVGHYNTRHPRGNKFTPEELRKHRERAFRLMEQPPGVYDAVAGELIMMSDVSRRALEDVRPPRVIDLHHEARVARYLSYVVRGCEEQGGGRLRDAIRSFETALGLAESDETLRDYMIGGNYCVAKLHLWECYLDDAWNDRQPEWLHRAINLGFDADAVLEELRRSGAPGGLSCHHWYYLLLQECLFLRDTGIRERSPVEERIDRITSFIELVHNPFCPGSDPKIVKRADDVLSVTRQEIVRDFPNVLFPERSR